MRSFVVILVLLTFNIGAAQNRFLDSLEQQLSVVKSDTSKLQLLSDLNWHYLGVSLERSKEFAQKEIALADKLGNQKFLAQGYNDYGIALIQQSKFAEGIVYHTKALEIRRKIGDKPGIGSSLSKLGYCYTELDDYKKALSAQLEALRIFQEIDHKPHIAYTLNNICNLYEELGDYSKIKEYALMSYELLKGTDDKAGISNALSFMATGMVNERNFQKAIEHQMEALKIRQEIHDSEAVAVSYNNIGFYYNNLGDNENAIKNFKTALNIVDLIGDERRASIYNNNIGGILFADGKFSEAEKYFRKGLQQASRQNYLSALIISYKNLGKLYAETGKGDSAVFYIDRYTLLKDSLFNADLASRISEMQTIYEVEKKEGEKQLLAKDVELKSVQLARSRATTGFLILALALVGALSYLLYNRYRLKQKQLMQKELLKQQELRTKAVIDAEENERVRIARELHDGVGQQLSAAKLNISGLIADPLKTSPLLDNALGLIDDAVREVRAVSHNMMANDVSRNGLAQALHSFVTKINSSGQIKISLEVDGLEQRLEPASEIVIYRVIQEIINNTIRHARATEVSLQVIRHPDELVVISEDNGVGFDVSDPGRSDGVGLRNMRSRVEYLQGSLSVDSYPGKGTTVVVEVPLTRVMQ